MPIATTPTRDERTIATVNASYRQVYLVLSFGLLLITAYRSYALNDASWELLGLVELVGGVSAAYQGAHHVLTRRWALMSGVAVAVAAALAAAIVVVRR